MAKGNGLYGNFRGKVGNTVGYSLKDSNNKQTQGVRIYQPVVKNPKTYAQAEQRMKLAPINATYRLLKPIIDRGQENLAYGNKSRLAWLSAAIKSFAGGYFNKGVTVDYPALVQLTKGSLQCPVGTSMEEFVAIPVGAPSSTVPSTIEGVSAALLATYGYMQTGDQITFVTIGSENGTMLTKVASFVINPDGEGALPGGFTVEGNLLKFAAPTTHLCAYTIVLSREGSNGQHLRSTSILTKDRDYYDSDLLTDEAKEAAIKSYMAASGNIDWPEESIQ